MKTVYLPVEISAREWLSRLLIGTACTSKGLRAVVGSKAVVNRVARFSKSGVYLTKDLKNISNELYLNLREAGIFVIGCDEESFTQIANNPVPTSDSDVVKSLELVTTGTRREHDHFLRTYSDRNGRFHLTGSSRFELLNPRFDRALSVRKKGPNSHRPTVLIATNFAVALWNPYRYQTDDYLVHVSDRQRLPQGFENLKWVWDRTSYYRHLVADYLELMQTLSNAFPECDFIVRPHPEENRKLWSLFLSTLPKNVSIDDSGSITEWLRCIDVFISAGSTTALEAAAYGVPTIFYSPQFSPWFESADRPPGSKVYSDPAALEFDLRHFLGQGKSRLSNLSEHDGASLRFSSLFSEVGNHDKKRGSLLKLVIRIEASRNRLRRNSGGSQKFVPMNATETREIIERFAEALEIATPRSLVRSNALVLEPR